MEIVPLQLVYRCKKESATFVQSTVLHAMRDFERFGYILGKGVSGWIAEDGKRVQVSAYFVGKEAWNRARTDERCNEDLRHPEVRNGPAEVIRLKRPYAGPVPVCKCGTNANPPLVLWCTPETLCAPLLCAKGGVIEYWKLPLSTSLVWDLYRWRELVRHVAQVALIAPPKPRDTPHALDGKSVMAMNTRGSDEGPRSPPGEGVSQTECVSGAQPLINAAWEWLSDKKGWLASTSMNLAKRVEDETGRKVKVVSPPIHLFAL